MELGRRELTPPSQITRRRTVVAVSVILVAAVVAGVLAYRHAHPPRMKEATRWSPAASSAGGVAKVFAPLTRGKFNCGDTFQALGGAADGPLFVTEDTCEPTAGGTEPGRYHPNKRRPRIVLNELLPDGTARQLPTPGGAGFRLVGVVSNGDPVAYGNNGQLLRYTDGEWRPLTRNPERINLEGRHTGDGGPATAALVVEPRRVVSGTNGSILIAEPYSVRQIDRAGTISTIAGSEGGVRNYFVYGGQDQVGVPSPEPITAKLVSATTARLPEIRDIAETRDGTIWVLGAQALYRLKDGMISRSVNFHGAPPSSLTVGTDGSTLYLYNTADGAVARVDLQEHRLVDLRPTPPGTAIGLDIRSSGSAYVGEPGGIYRLDKIGS